MTNPNNENPGNENHSYLLIAEKSGVAADEPAELRVTEDGRTILAHVAEDLADEHVPILPTKPATVNTYTAREVV